MGPRRLVRLRSGLRRAYDILVLGQVCRNTFGVGVGLRRGEVPLAFVSELFIPACGPHGWGCLSERAFVTWRALASCAFLAHRDMGRSYGEWVFAALVLGRDLCPLWNRPVFREP